MLVFSATLRRHRKLSSSLCSCWTCLTAVGPLATPPWPWSSVTLTPLRLRLVSPASCSWRRVWTWLRSSSSIHCPPGPGPPQPVRTLTGLLTALTASLDRRWPHNALTNHTSWTVQEVIATKARILESIHFEVVTIRRPTGFIFSPRAFPQGGTTSATHTTRCALPHSHSPSSRS